MSRFACLLAVALAVMFASTASASLGYTLDVTTFYQFADAGTIGIYHPSPDTGFFTITNNGTTTFTGTISDTAFSTGAGDFSQSFPGLTLTPGGSVTVATSPESSNVGGFNGPTSSPQPGVIISLVGLINGSEGVNLSVNDSQIHSGVPRTNPFGVTLDNYVLQGGDPFGRDTTDTFETSQAPGHFEFFQAGSTVPEPGYIALIGTALPVLFFARRRRAVK